jgi:sugar phosphate permease
LIATGVAIGASSSNLGAGFVAQHFGYDAGFLALAAVAVGGFVTLSLAMPETMCDSACSPFACTATPD